MTHLTKDQMKALLDQAAVSDRTGRLSLMILLGWRHGLRASEIISLRVQDFDLSGQRGYITVGRLKGSLRTTQELFSDEKAALLPFIAGKAPGAFLFPGQKPGRCLTYWAFWDQMHKLASKVGLPWHQGRTHCLKHTTGMTVIPKGIEYCRQYLGHKSIASTGAYLRVSDAEASRAAMAAFGD